jgi:CRISPR/Cas system-associated protein Csx1
MKKIYVSRIAENFRGYRVATYLYSFINVNVNVLNKRSM